MRKNECVHTEWGRSRELCVCVFDDATRQTCLPSPRTPEPPQPPRLFGSVHPVRVLLQGAAITVAFAVAVLRKRSHRGVVTLPLHATESYRRGRRRRLAPDGPAAPVSRRCPQEDTGEGGSGEEDEREEG